MTSEQDFADEEWTRIRRAPLVAGVAIPLADPVGRSSGQGDDGDVAVGHAYQATVTIVDTSSGCVPTRPIARRSVR
jgi:hypothetical protein